MRPRSTIRTTSCEILTSINFTPFPKRKITNWCTTREFWILSLSRPTPTGTSETLFLLTVFWSVSFDNPVIYDCGMLACLLPGLGVAVACRSEHTLRKKKPRRSSSNRTIHSNTHHGKGTLTSSKGDRSCFLEPSISDLIQCLRVPSSAKVEWETAD